LFPLSNTQEETKLSNPEQRMYGLIEDPLDSPDFDPIAFINQNFPTESSLDGLDTFVVGITSQISTLDEEISRAVQAQSAAGKQASKDIEDAQGSIVELFDKIQEIKAKASQSERMVNEICHDIKKLDCAKTHLQASITSLKRLQMLLTAVDQLELLAQEYQYREAANLLDAVKQLMTHFDRYDTVPLVVETKDRVTSIQKNLRLHVRYTHLPLLLIFFSSNAFNFLLITTHFLNTPSFHIFIPLYRTLS
jgi:hypothetical protein